jgi:GABA(A) receptor-associated protein
MLRNKYIDRVPIIIESTNNIKLENYKYLLPKTLKFSDFYNIVKTKIKLDRKQAIFMFVKSECNYVLVPLSETVETIYGVHQSNDGFLYIKFGIENTFG